MTEQTTTPDPSGLDLSDAANAALYPDVEHPDPEQLPPEAFQVPLPIEQRESPLLDVIRAYATGQADWPTTKQALIDFPYAQNLPVAGSPLSTSGSQGDWYADVEANAGISSPDNTWGQLQEAKNAGMLTRDEFNQVLAEKASRGQQTERDAQAKAGGDPTPGEGKAWSEAARAAAYKSRMEHLRARLGQAAAASVADAAHGQHLTAEDHDVILSGISGVRQDGRSSVTEDEIAKHVRDDHGAVLRYSNVLAQRAGTVRGQYAEDPATAHARLHGADTTPEEGKRITDAILSELDKHGVKGGWWGDKSNGLMPIGHQGETGYSVHDHGTHLRIHVPTSKMPGVRWDKSAYRDYGDGPEPDWSPINPEAGHKVVADAVEKATGRKPSKILPGGYSTQGEENISYSVIVPKGTVAESQGPFATPRNSSQADAADPIQLPRPRRTTLLPNRAIVQHEDGRVGRIRHISVAELRTGHTLVNPVTGKHAGKVTGVHVRSGGVLKEADDRTPLGADRIVHVDGVHTGTMGMGARYSVFEPFA